MSATPPRLSPSQRRVLGVLIEKAKTTPGGYPMSLNAVITGCNQKNNRDPITSLDEADVMNALNKLIDLGAAEEIDWVGRVPKYKHLAYDWLQVSKAELAVLGELLLRGAQQLGELRGRANRMEPIADLGALKPIVDGLVERGLAIELTPPGRGQVVSHGLYKEPELEELRARYEGGAPAPTPGGSSNPAPSAPSGNWREELDELRAELAELAERVRELEAGRGPRPG